MVENIDKVIIYSYFIKQIIQILNFKSLLILGTQKIYYYIIVCKTYYGDKNKFIKILLMVVVSFFLILYGAYIYLCMYYICQNRTFDVIQMYEIPLYFSCGVCDKSAYFNMFDNVISPKPPMKLI